MSSVQLANPAPGAQIPDTSQQGIVNFLRPLLSLVGVTGSTGGTGTVFAQQATPSTAQQGGIWLRLSNDTNGQPLGFYYYYQARWCLVQMQRVGTIVEILDDPTPYFNLTTGLGLFDGGTTGVAGDWYGWQLFLQGNSTHIQNRLPAIANAYDSVGHQWTITLPDGSNVSSIDRSTAAAKLDPTMIPSLPVTGFEYDPAGTGTVPQVLVSTKYSGTARASDGTTSGIITPSQAKLNNYPPTSVLGFARFRGYTYLDPTVALA